MEPQSVLWFGVVRDPVEWVVSWYNFRSRPALADSNHKRHSVYTGSMTFAEFWLQYRDDLVLRPQSQRFLRKDGQLIDVIIPLDQLTEGLAEVQRVLGLGGRLGRRRNVSPTRQAPSEVPSSIASEIREHFDVDYRLLDSCLDRNERSLEEYVQRTRSLSTPRTESLAAKVRALSSRFR